MVDEFFDLKKGLELELPFDKVYIYYFNLLGFLPLVR